MYTVFFHMLSKISPSNFSPSLTLKREIVRACAKAHLKTRFDFTSKMFYIISVNNFKIIGNTSNVGWRFFVKLLMILVYHATLTNLENAKKFKQSKMIKINADYIIRATNDFADLFQ